MYLTKMEGFTDIVLTMSEQSDVKPGNLLNLHDFECMKKNSKNIRKNSLKKRIIFFRIKNRADRRSY